MYAIYAVPLGCGVIGLPASPYEPTLFMVNSALHAFESFCVLPLSKPAKSAQSRRGRVSLVCLVLDF